MSPTQRTPAHTGLNSIFTGSRPSRRTAASCHQAFMISHSESFTPRWRRLGQLFFTVWIQPHWRVVKMNSLFSFMSMGFGHKKLKVLECLRQPFRGEPGLFLTFSFSFLVESRFHVSLITVSHAKHTTTTFDWCGDVFIKCHVSAAPAVTQTCQNKSNSSVHRIFFQTFRCHCGLWANTFPQRADMVWMVYCSPSYQQLSCSDGWHHVTLWQIPLTEPGAAINGLLLNPGH